MRPDYVGLGGFDSHTLPPVGRRAIAFALLLCGASAAVAQQPPPPPAGPTVVSARVAMAQRDAPPISPGRAFMYSALIPGWGQAALDRKYTGAAFFFIEAFSVAMVFRSLDDVKLAKGFQGDSVPLRYDIDATTGQARRTPQGDPVVLQWQQNGYTNDLVRARKLMVEDWAAVVIFNHLISGVDALVAANLWDLPAHVSMRAFPVRGGTAYGFSAAFR